MSRSFRPWQPTQSYLFPPSPTEWLPEGHLVFFLLDLLPQLDLRGIEAKYEEKDPRGHLGFDPRMMTALLLYGYATGIASSRRLEKATYEDVAFRVLTAGEHPDHSRICDFRRRHLEELQGLFLQILRLCQKAGLVKLGHVALDGTKVKANASKHKAMSYDRMLKGEQELTAEIQNWLKQTEQVDQSEDALHGPGHRGDELPDELQRRHSRLAKIQKAKAELEAEAAAAHARKLAAQAAEKEREAQVAAAQAAEKERQAQIAAEQAAEKERKAWATAGRAALAVREATAAAAGAAKAEAERKNRLAQKAAKKAARAARKAKERAGKARKGPPDLTSRGPDDLPSHQVKADSEGNPDAKAQMSFTDPESRIMKNGGDFQQSYNCQAAVDEAHQIIVAEAVTNQAPDAQHLPPLVNQMIDNCDGALPWRFTADAGYWSEANDRHCKDRHLDAYIATGRLKRGEVLPPVCGRIPESLDAKGRMARKLRTSKGKAAYARRKATVEPVFGQIKDARGFRHFLLRGLDKVRGEWALICATHNLLKLFHATVAPTAAPA